MKGHLDVFIKTGSLTIGPYQIMLVITLMKDQRIQNIFLVIVFKLLFIILLILKDCPCLSNVSE